MRNDTLLYVQYGCGLSAPPGWKNFDASPTLRLQRVPLVGGGLTRKGPRFPANVLYGDIVRGLPLPDASCRAIYCSHVLEHLALEDLRVALRNTRRHLTPGGTFRFVLPDLEVIARKYVDSSDEDASLTFLNESLLGTKTRARGVGGLVRLWAGNKPHLWMWDFKSLSAELRKAGFVNIRRAHFGDSGEPKFAEVEELPRWDGALGVQCARDNV